MPIDPPPNYIPGADPRQIDAPRTEHQHGGQDCDPSEAAAVRQFEEEGPLPLDAVLAYAASPPEYPDMVLVPTADMERLRRARDLGLYAIGAGHPDAGNKDRNHYDWFMPSNPTSAVDDYIDEFEAKCIEGLTDSFMHDMSQSVLPLIAAYRECRAAAPQPRDAAVERWLDGPNLNLPQPRDAAIDLDLWTEASMIFAAAAVDRTDPKQRRQVRRQVEEIAAIYDRLRAEGSSKPPDTREGAAPEGSETA